MRGAVGFSMAGASGEFVAPNWEEYGLEVLIPMKGEGFTAAGW